MRGEINVFSIMKLIKKQLGSGQSTQQEVGKTLDYVSCFPFTLQPLPACFTTEQSTIKASLFVARKEALLTIPRLCPHNRSGCSERVTFLSFATSE